MRLHLGGHLNWYEAEKRAWLDVPLAGPARLAELVERLGVPGAEIGVGVVNGRVVELDKALVADGDEVELYPPVGGG